jgi:hypothetical protein
MSCDVRKLSAFADGDLAPKKAARLREHLERCTACRQALAEIETLKGALADEAAHPPEPPAHGFADVMRRLETTPQLPWRRWFAATAMATAMALVAGAALYRHRHASSVSDDQLIAEAEQAFRAADAQYREAIGKLRTVTARARTDWPAGRQKEYDDAALALEQATQKCLNVARTRPADSDAEALLFAAYQKQIRFMQDQLWRGVQR